MATFDVAQGGGSATTTSTPSQPSTTQVGDLLLVACLVDGSAALSLRFSVGTLIRSVGPANPATYAAWWVLAAAAGSRTLGTLSWDGASRYNAWSVTRIPPGTFNFDARTPIGDSAGGTNASSRSMVFPAVSPAMSGCLSVLLGGIDQAGTGTPPAGYTEQLDNSIGCYVATGDSVLASGASGTKTVTLSTALETGAIHVAIAPAPASLALSPGGAVTAGGGTPAAQVSLAAGGATGGGPSAGQAARTLPGGAVGGGASPGVSAALVPGGASAGGAGVALPAAAPSQPSATLAAATAQRADVTVWLQALDGTWEACGRDRLIGVVPESLECESDAYGSKTASFDLKRPVFALWPDIAAFAPCMIEVAGQIVWRGRTGQTPLRDGADFVINVQCVGSQARLDDDVYQPFYVHSSLSDWQDARSNLAADLTSLVSVPQVQAGAGMISITYPSGQATAGRGAVLLDLGPSCRAKRVVLDWSVTAASGSRAIYLGYSDASANAAAATTQLIYNATGASSNTFAYTLPTASRYVFIIHDANSHTPAADETLKITRALVFGDAAYESGNASIVKASTVIGDALDRATMRLSPDRSGIQASSFAIPDLAPDEERTPREMIDGVNAFHNWVTKLDTQDRMIFKPRPTAPLLEIGAWQGSELTDSSANNGDEIYNRCIARGQGPDGSPVIVTRLVQGLIGSDLAGVQFPNPSFGSDASGWTGVSRSTTNYASAPAGGFASLPATVTTSTSGLEPGRAYELRCSFGLYLYDLSRAAYVDPSGSIGTATWRVTDSHGVILATTTDDGSVVLRFTAPESGAITLTVVAVETLSDPFGRYRVDLVIDDCYLYSWSRPASLVDRRGFRRTFILRPSFKLTTAVGQQLTDTFLDAHRTTPYRGSCRITPGGVRYVLGGSAPHPSVLLTMTQELLWLSHRIDPDTGAQGRTGTIATVKYTHRDQAAAVELDDPRRNFDALLARLAVVQGAGQ